MPTTIASLIVAVFAILPGFPGYSIYSTMIGSDWRLKDWEKIVRFLTFSIFGLILYSLFAQIVRLPPANYILPSTFTSGTFSINLLPNLLIAYIGHFAASALSGFVSAWTRKALTGLTPSLPFPSAWDSFIRGFVPGHWAVVSLSNGQAYAGMIQCADLSVGESERDVILREPAKYDRESHQYISMPYQHLFLRASLISSMATVYTSEDDSRITEIGKRIFKQEESNG